MQFIKSRILKSLLCLFVFVPGLVLGQVMNKADLPTGTTEPQQANLTITNTSDPANHGCCVIAPPTIWDLFIQEGELVLREQGGTNSVPWLDFDPMAIDDNLQFSGESRATVAGFGNVLTRITGTIGQNDITAQLTIGADGGLPTGAPIVYDLLFGAVQNEYFFTNFFSLHVEAGLNLNFITADDIQREEISGPDDGVELFVSIDLGGDQGDADWWIVMLSGEGDFFSYDLATGDFVPGLMPTATGPLIDVPEPISILSHLVPPSNETTIVFGVERNPDGLLDADQLYGAGFTFWFK